MVKVAALRITTSGKKVRVACGKFSDSFLPSDWGDAIANSVHRPILLNADENVDSKRIYLYRGMGFRLSSHDTIADINRAIQELQRPKPQQAPNTYSLAPFGHLQGRAQQAEPAYAVTAQPSAPFPAVTPDGMVRILLSLAKQRSLSTEGDHSYFLGIATQKGMAIAQRCVARNILKTKISRHIPQDIKIAVAIRDGGQCTHMDSLNQRCSAKVDLQFDHRFWPFSLGGTQEMWNLTLKCGDHNREESDNIDFRKALREAVGVYLRW